MKVDVIIPTIMNADHSVFHWLLMELHANDQVQTIFIIDNTNDQAFFQDYRHMIGAIDKIKVINGNDKGFYVNDAWNFGIESCKDSPAELWCLLNDDILVSKEIMSCMCNEMDKHRDISLLTTATTNNIAIKDYIKTCRDISKANLQPMSGRQGWIMLGRKSQWSHIPDQLKIFYGDDWIYREMKKIGQIRILEGINVSHFQSSSVNKNMGRIKPIIEQDDKEWAKLCHTK